MSLAHGWAEIMALIARRGALHVTEAESVVLEALWRCGPLSPSRLIAEDGGAPRRWAREWLASAEPDPPMAYTLYDATLPALTRGLNNLSAILKKAEAFAVEKGMDPSELLSAKLAEDMFPLSRQVQIVSDTAKSGAGRLAQIDMPSWPDTETSFDQLQQRIATTQAYLSGVTAEQVNGAEDRIITLPMPGTEMKLPGRMFAAGFVLPNFYFHITTAYAILRHKGVPLGKMDFLGGA